jgi:hypothetical protein
MGALASFFSKEAVLATISEYLYGRVAIRSLVRCSFIVAVCGGRQTDSYLQEDPQEDRDLAFAKAFIPAFDIMAIFYRFLSPFPGHGFPFVIDWVESFNFLKLDIFGADMRLGIVEGEIEGHYGHQENRD